MQDQMAKLEWRDGVVPVSTRFDDPYFSLENGLAETRHVFLDGNALPERFCNRFQIGELGFGTGLNFLTSVLAWQDHDLDGQFRFTSFEAYPMSRDEMERSLSQFPEITPLVPELLDFWASDAREHVLYGDVCLEVIRGDARDELPRWRGKADAWYLDGFSPAKNPELWEDQLLQQVAQHTNPGGTVATYSAAGAVRRALDQAGFTVERRPGYGRKRHMSVGKLRA